MLSEEEENHTIQPQQARNIWVITFADLMAILMCFFILQLSFSEINLGRFKEITGSLKNAFGVQKQESQKNSNLVTKKDNNPEINSAKLNIKITEQRTPAGTDAAAQELLAQKIRLRAEALNTVRTFKGALTQEVELGQLEVEAVDNQVIIRIPEKGVFDSGSDEMHDTYFPVLSKLRDQLISVRGLIQVKGHTDNIPIDNMRFRSNWDLSSARAATVVQFILQNQKLDPKQYVVMGYADTHPRAPNDTPENRAKNRRVEIIITYE